MGYTVEKFHGLLADLLISSRRQHDGRPGPGQPGYLGDASADAVTVWRHAAHVANIYANGAGALGIRPGWEAFWEKGMDRAAYLRLLDERSRILRAVQNGGDMDTYLYDDSVRYWEYDLATMAITKADHLAAAERYGKKDAVRRIELEMYVTMTVIVMYTGLDRVTIGRTIRECGETRPEYPTHTGTDGARAWKAHPLFDLITAHRPTV
jgi:hypothetical protein